MATEIQRILYVDDDRDSCDLMAVLLKLAIKNFTLECSVSGAAAMKAIAARPFDLYILEFQLPDIDGTSLCRWIRESGSAEPIVFYSATGLAPEREAAMTAGADAYLVKPTDVLQVNRVVSELLANPA